jgi:hypothetical protein
MCDPIPFPPPVAAVLGQLSRQIALLTLRRETYATGALAMIGVEDAHVDWNALTYLPKAVEVEQACGP